MEPAVPVEVTAASCGGAAGVTPLANADSLGDIVWCCDRAGSFTFARTNYSWTATIKHPLTGESVAYDGRGMKAMSSVEGLGLYSNPIHVPVGRGVASI